MQKPAKINSNFGSPQFWKQLSVLLWIFQYGVSFSKILKYCKTTRENKQIIIGQNPQKYQSKIRAQLMGK